MRAADACQRIEGGQRGRERAAWDSCAKLYCWRIDDLASSERCLENKVIGVVLGIKLGDIGPVSHAIQRRKL